jgi:DNA-binding CsgD family transcriptional regulator/tetratricopeptide (TPR) repeat protein
VLREAADRAQVGSDRWCAAQFWLGTTAMLFSADLAGALNHFTVVRDATGERGPSRALADCLASRSVVMSNLGRIAEAVDDARRALAVARQLGYPAGQALALERLSIAAYYAGDHDSSVRLARQAEQIPGDIPGWIARICSNWLVEMLIASGDLAAAQHVCAEGLAQSRDTGDLWSQARLLTRMAILELRAGRTTDAAVQLREALQISTRIGERFDLAGGLGCCGDLCAETGRHAEAVTVWAASAALSRYGESGYTPATARRRRELQRKARQALGDARADGAEERGAAMSAATAAEYALLVTTPQPAGPPELGQLSARERQLVMLVAQGRTDTQIAAELSISVRTVGSHLDRIRDKTGCRRRADLTRLALTAGLV